MTEYSKKSNLCDRNIRLYASHDWFKPGRGWMTILVCVLVADGIVLSADSRQVRLSASKFLRTDSDYAEKILPLSSRAAAVICGQGFFYTNDSESPKSINAIIRSAANRLPQNSTVKEIAMAVHEELSQAANEHSRATQTQITDIPISFYLAGYSPNCEVGELYRCDIPGEVVLNRQTSDAGAVWNGQHEIIDRLILGYDPRFLKLITLPDDIVKTIVEQSSKLQLFINFQTFNLQDAVNFVSTLVNTTISLQNLSDGIVGMPGQFPVCGGALDVAVIKPIEGFSWINHKNLGF